MCNTYKKVFIYKRLMASIFCWLCCMRWSCEWHDEKPPHRKLLWVVKKSFNFLVWSCSSSTEDNLVNVPWLVKPWNNVMVKLAQSHHSGYRSTRSQANSVPVNSVPSHLGPKSTRSQVNSVPSQMVPRQLGPKAGKLARAGGRAVRDRNPSYN